MVRAFALVDECEVEWRQRLKIKTGVEIMVLQCRVDVTAWLHPVVAPECEHLRGEGERSECRPTVRFVGSNRGDVVPVFRREIFHAGADALAGVSSESIEAGCRVRGRRDRQV